MVSQHIEAQLREAASHFRASALVRVFPSETNAPVPSRHLAGSFCSYKPQRKRHRWPGLVPRFLQEWLLLMECHLLVRSCLPTQCKVALCTPHRSSPPQGLFPVPLSPFSSFAVSSPKAGSVRTAFCASFSQCPPRLRTVAGTHWAYERILLSGVVREKKTQKGDSWI